MKRLSRADILSRAAPKTKDIEVPEWAIGREKPPVVTIRSWAIRDADIIATSIAKLLNGETTPEFVPQIVAVSLVDHETGALLFGSEKGVEELCERDAAGLNRIANAAFHFNEMGHLAADEEGERLRAERIAEFKKRAEAEEAEDPKN